jgi:asparagine synthetase B (glutamine-hydrolysing)
MYLSATLSIAFPAARSTPLAASAEHWAPGGLAPTACEPKTTGSRSRLGIKPLYLTSLPGRIRFASTLPALLAPGGVDTAVDDLALHHYLSWHSIVPAPRTILKGVEKLPAATIRTVRADGTWCDREYWQPSYTSRKSTRAGPQGTGRRRWLRRCGRQYDGGWWPTCR